MYSQMSKCISLSSPCTYIHCTRFPTFTCFKCKSHFLELEFVLVTSQRKVVNYVQLIRSDGTPPTQAPPSNSGSPLPLPPPLLLALPVSLHSGGSGQSASI